MLEYARKDPTPPQLWLLAAVQAILHCDCLQEEDEREFRRHAARIEGAASHQWHEMFCAAPVKHAKHAFKLVISPAKDPATVVRFAEPVLRQIRDADCRNLCAQAALQEVLARNQDDRHMNWGAIVGPLQKLLDILGDDNFDELQSDWTAIIQRCWQRFLDFDEPSASIPDMESGVSNQAADITGLLSELRPFGIDPSPPSPLRLLPPFPC